MATVEQQVLRKLQLRYDELNALEAIVDTGTFFEFPKEDAKKKFEECLFWLFVDGFESGILWLGLEDMDMPNGYEVLNYEYPDGETVLEKFDKHFDAKDPVLMKLLMECETHRMYSTGSLASTFGNEKKVTKTWHSMGDERVRETHTVLNGTTVPVDEYFHSPSGDYGLMPGMFQTADENANCRCWVSFGWRKDGR